MHRTTFLLFIAAGLCLLFPIACRDYSGDAETSHPLYVKAMSLKTEKNYAEAAKALEEFLAIRPKSGKAHYELACIYSDNLQNFPFAIYHFNKYISYSKLGREDQEQIRRYISYCREAENKLFRSEHGDANSSASYAPGTESSKLMAARAELNALNAKFRRLCAAHPEVRDYWRALDGDTNVPPPSAAEAAARPAAVQPRPEPAVPTNGVRLRTADAERRVDSVVPLPDPRSAPRGAQGGEERIYTVQPGDTLQKIALRFYGSRSRTAPIRSANNLKGDNIRIGQKLKIPPSVQGGRR